MSSCCYLPNFRKSLCIYVYVYFFKNVVTTPSIYATAPWVSILLCTISQVSPIKVEVQLVLIFRGHPVPAASFSSFFVLFHVQLAIKSITATYYTDVWLLELDYLWQYHMYIINMLSLFQFWISWSSLQIHPNTFMLKQWKAIHSLPHTDCVCYVSLNILISGKYQK